MRALTAVLVLLPMHASAELHVVVVEGLGGEPRYAEQFDNQVVAIENASRTVTSSERIRIFRTADASRAAILAYFDSLAQTITGNDQLLVYLIGHGSYDEHDYKFNIKGPDLTGSDIAAALAALPDGNRLLVNTSSASGALARLLEGEAHSMILATRSGTERHATRFGMHYARALTDPAADTDKNQIITAKEAFNYAERGVSDYFERNDRLSTEHARIEGTLADRFPVARLGAGRTTQSQDPVLADLIDRRAALNAGIDELRLARERMSAEDYRGALLERMLELARLEDAIEEREQELADNE